jgi:hypothetical protein
VVKMKLTATLTAINSNVDRNGNCYWALRFVDHETGKVVHGLVSGGESNIYAILRYWNDGRAPLTKTGDWNRSIQFLRESLPIRQFKALTAGWKYAGCDPQELAQFIRQELAITP